MKTLLTYDISNTKYRTKVATLLESYGYRVNFSVFELDITKPKLNILLKKLQPFIAKEDSLRVYYFSKDTIAKSYELNQNRLQPFQKRDNYVE
jgi:CRISPR-associated protein Cas2